MKKNIIILPLLIIGLILCSSCAKTDGETDSYTVVFSQNYQNAPEADIFSIESGGTVSDPEDPQRENYSFAGWYCDSIGIREFSFDTPIEENTRLFAKWEQTATIVKFNTLGGSGIESQTVAVGETVQRPDTDPQKENYVFAGWYLESEGRTEFDFETTAVTDDITIYAKWKQENAAVTFVQYEEVKSEELVSLGEKVKEPSMEPARENYKFTGWYSDVACTKKYDFSTPVEEDITVYAGWELVAATVIFETGTENIVETVEAGTAIEQPETPERAGWKFAGWYTGTSDTAEEYDFKNKVVSNLTLYAKWEKAEYTVTFDYNCPELENTVQTISYGQSVEFPENDPEREGYLFMGWYADAEGKEFFDDTQLIEEDTVIYAGWEAE